jgi:hypothetical protein
MTVSRPWRRTAVRARELWAVAAITAVTSALASCSTQTPASNPTPSAGSYSGGRLPAGSQPAWMLTKTALTQMATEPAVLSQMQRSRIYEILRPGQRPLALAGAQPVVTFPSVSELAQVVGGHELPPGTTTVLYDPEVWPFTPRAEQLDPAKAAQQARDIAHAHGLRLIVAPALNLTTAQPGGSGTRAQQFLSLGLAGAIARSADVIELQAQSLERNRGTYAAFVRAAAAQARAANPRVTVLAGLSTNPPGAVVSSSQLATAIRATSGIVNGYWLNIPGQGARCPTCNAPRPDVGRAALREVL